MGMKRKKCKKLPFWDWSYNNPVWDRKFMKIYKSIEELDEFLKENKEKGRKNRKK